MTRRSPICNAKWWSDRWWSSEDATSPLLHPFRPSPSSSFFLPFSCSPCSFSLCLASSAFSAASSSLRCVLSWFIPSFQHSGLCVCLSCQSPCSFSLCFTSSVFSLPLVPVYVVLPHGDKLDQQQLDLAFWIYLASKQTKKQTNKQRSDFLCAASLKTRQLGSCTILLPE